MVVFIKPPSFDVLKARLLGRGTETEEALKIRLENAKRELTRSNDYDYVIVNDDLDRAYLELRALISSLLVRDL